jgi:hypothetical protein
LITAEVGEPIVLAWRASGRERLVLKEGSAQDVALAPGLDG